MEEGRGRAAPNTLLAHTSVSSAWRGGLFLVDVPEGGIFSNFTQPLCWESEGGRGTGVRAAGVPALESCVSCSMRKPRLGRWELRATCPRSQVPTGSSLCPEPCSQVRRDLLCPLRRPGHMEVLR